MKEANRLVGFGDVWLPCSVLSPSGGDPVIREATEIAITELGGVLVCQFFPPPGLVWDFLRFLPVTILLAALCSGYEVWVLGRITFEKPQSQPRWSRKMALSMSIASWLLLLIAVVVAVTVIAPSDIARRAWYDQQSTLLNVGCLSALDRAYQDALNDLLRFAALPAFLLWIAGFVLSLVTQAARGLTIRVINWNG